MFLAILLSPLYVAIVLLNWARQVVSSWWESVFKR